jgi:hypothetical protein
MVSHHLFDGGGIGMVVGHPKKKQRTIANRLSTARFDEGCGAVLASMVTTKPAMRL